ncbi:MAG: DUF4384 domain-containing protein [Deltaproteobacteria bacterium]
MQNLWAKLRLPLALLLTAVVSLGVGGRAEDSQSAADDESTLSFRWTVAACLDSLGGSEIIQITEDYSLYPGDVLKIYISPVKNAYVYAYLAEPENDVRLLFPASIEDFNQSRANGGGKYYIPAGGDWLLPKQQKGGKSVIYLLASAQRLRRLETLTEKYLAAAKSAKERASADLIAEIRDLKRRNSKFAAEPEKPIEVAGSYGYVYIPTYPRETDIETLATVVEAVNFFSKTIRIEHK